MARNIKSSTSSKYKTDKDSPNEQLSGNNDHGAVIERDAMLSFSLKRSQSFESCAEIGCTNCDVSCDEYFQPNSPASIGNVLNCSHQDAAKSTTEHDKTDKLRTLHRKKRIGAKPKQDGLERSQRVSEKQELRVFKDKTEYKHTKAFVFQVRGDCSHVFKPTSPATRPRVRTASSPLLQREHLKSGSVSPSPVSSASQCVHKETGDLTRDSSDSDFRETLRHQQDVDLVPQFVTKISGNPPKQVPKSFKRRRVRSKCSSFTGSSSSVSTSSCSSRCRSYSSRSCSSHQRRSYTCSTLVSSRSSRSTSRSCSRRRIDRRHGRRRHNRHRRRSFSPSSCSRSSYSSVSSRDSRRRFSRSGGFYRHKSYCSYSSYNRHGRFTSTDRSRSANSRSVSRIPPPPGCQSLHTSGGVVTASGSINTSKGQISLEDGASLDSQKLTGLVGRSPSPTPSASPKINESNIDEQVPPLMAKKPGLSINSPPLPTVSNVSSIPSRFHSWEAHVGPKRKSGKVSNEIPKKHSDNNLDFMKPPENDEQYKALQEQAREHVRQQLQQVHLQASQQQQLAAAVAAVASSSESAIPPTVSVPSVVFQAQCGQPSLMDQLRQRQQFCHMTGASAQAMLLLQGLIRQQTEAQTINVAMQQQTTPYTAAQHHFQSIQQAVLRLLAMQQQKPPAAAAISAAQHHQQALMQGLLQHRQQVIAVAQQQLLLQMRAQHQVAMYAAISANSTQVTGNPSYDHAALNTSTSTTKTATAEATVDEADSQFATVLAALAAVQRNQELQQEEWCKQIIVANMVPTNTAELALDEQHRSLLLALQTVAAQQHAASQPSVSSTNLSAVQQQMAAVYQQQHTQSQQQQQAAAAAFLSAAQQSQLLRPS